MPSTACWSWDARVISASLDPERGRGCCAHVPDPCTTAPDLLSLVHDQTRQNWDLLQALTTAVAWDKVVEAVDWNRVFQIQSEFARGSLERSAQLTQRYLEVTQTVMTATASATRQQVRKAA